MNIRKMFTWLFRSGSVAQGTEDPPEIQYYDCDGRIIATVGAFGFQGMFLLNKSPEMKWVYLDLDSPEGDALNQQIFLAHDADLLNEAPEGAPPLPLDEKHPSYPREHYYETRPSVPAGEAPRVAALLREQGKALKVHIFLRESIYESTYGDGHFHYLYSAYATAGDARRKGPSDDQYYCYHKRRITLFVENEAIKWRDFHLKLYDRYAPDDVIESLEESLGEDQ